MCGLCEAARHSFMQMHREELNTTVSQQKPRRSVFFQSAKSFCGVRSRSHRTLRSEHSREMCQTPSDY